jgi:hypothetical protein
VLSQRRYEAGEGTPQERALYAHLGACPRCTRDGEVACADGRRLRADAAAREREAEKHERARHRGEG